MTLADSQSEIIDAFGVVAKDLLNWIYGSNEMTLEKYIADRLNDSYDIFDCNTGDPVPMNKVEFVIKCCLISFESEHHKLVKIEDMPTPESVAEAEKKAKEIK